jgi:hypothetical protein
VASYPEKSKEELLRLAGKAMYRVKYQPRKQRLCYSIKQYGAIQLCNKRDNSQAPDKEELIQILKTDFFTAGLFPVCPYLRGDVRMHS